MKNKKKLCIIGVSALCIVIGELYSLKLEIENMNHMEYKLICGICIGKSKEKEYGVEFKELQHFLLGVL